jgi:small redox-active disulfide protein 2
LEIKILGTGCKKCSELFENTKEAVAKKGIFAKIDKIEDYNEILSYNVMNTPAIVVNGEVKASGKVLSSQEILSLLNQ